MQIPPPRKRLIPDPDRRNQRQKRALECAAEAGTALSGAVARGGPNAGR